MNMRLVIICFSLFFIDPLYSQTDNIVITVIARDSGKPLEFVSIHHPSGTHTVTNSKGEADITPFLRLDSLFFSLVGYKPLVLAISEVAARSYRIELESQTFLLGEFTVSANRWEQDGERVTKQVTVIRPKDIAAFQPGTAADLLESSGEVFVQRSQLGGGSPMLRGFSANRVLIVVDGVRMNNAIYRSGNLQNVISVDPNTVERAEVLHGPGAISYGSDAIGGVMDFHLLSPKFSPDTTLLFKGGSMVRYGSAANERTGHLHLRLGGRKVAFVGSYSQSGFDDLRSGTEGPQEFLRPWYVERIHGVDSMVANPDPSRQIGSGFGQRMIMAKLGYRPIESLQVDLNYYLSTTTDIPRYDRLIETRADGTPRSAEWNYGPQRWTMRSVQVLYSRKNDLFDKARVVVAHQEYEESRNDRSFRSDRLRRQAEQVSGIWATIDLTKEIGKRLQLLYGGETVSNLVGSTGSQNDLQTEIDQPINSRYPDGSTWNTSAVYAGAIFDLTEKVALNGGIRFNVSSLECLFDTTLFPYPVQGTALHNAASTGSAGVSYRPGKEWKLTMDLGTGFRAPNIDDIGKVFESAPGMVVVPNPGLRPEYAYNSEIGVEKIISGEARIRITGYGVLLEDAMVRRPFQLNGVDSLLFEGEPSRVEALMNASRAWVVGGNIAFDASLGRGFTLDLRYNWQMGKESDDITGEDVPLRHAPPPFGQAGLGWEKGRVRLNFQAAFSNGFSFEELAPTEQAKPVLYANDGQGRPYSPGWLVFDLRSSFRIAKWFQFIAALENITDQLYRSYSSGISAPGRNFVASLRYDL